MLASTVPMSAGVLRRSGISSIVARRSARRATRIASISMVCPETLSSVSIAVWPKPRKAAADWPAGSENRMPAGTPYAVNE